MSGKYLAGKKKIKISKLITTLKACPEMLKKRILSAIY